MLPRCALEQPVAVEIDEYGGDFQQRIGLAIEAAGFHVDNNGKKTAEAVCHEDFVGH